MALCTYVLYRRCRSGILYTVYNLVYYKGKITRHYTKLFIVYEVVYSIPVAWCHFVYYKHKTFPSYR